MEMSLVLLDDGKPLVRRSVRFTLDLGRSGCSDLILLDRSVSHHHARVSLYGRRAEIRDLGSANGTFVNGQRTREHELAGEDRIKIGKTVLVFKA